MTVRRPIRERLLSFVEFDTAGGCWLWSGTISREGYGRFTLPNGTAQGRTTVTHRVSYEEFVGPIKPGLVVDHKCRVRCCVNPDHLQQVTQRENILSGTGASARNAMLTHCKKGHPLLPQKENRRSCVICNRVRMRETYRNRFRGLNGRPMKTLRHFGDDQ